MNSEGALVRGRVHPFPLSRRAVARFGRGGWPPFSEERGGSLLENLRRQRMDRKGRRCWLSPLFGAVAAAGLPSFVKVAS